MAENHNWNYYNGESYTEWKTGKHVYVPMTEAYCSDCAPKHLPGWDVTRKGTEHHKTGFRCAPWRVGRPCSHCGKDI